MAHEELTPVIRTSVCRLELLFPLWSREAILSSLCLFVIFDSEIEAQCSFNELFSRFLTEREITVFAESTLIRQVAFSCGLQSPFSLTPLIMECL